MKTFGVTSPHITGREVSRRQRLLDGKNVLGQDFLKGVVDGEFGPETGRACIRAKYWLGYLQRDQKPTYGEQLDNLLTGKVTLPPEMARRRATRLAAAKRPPLRVRALANARRDIGMVERPANSNRSPISDRWGLRGPWCNMAVSEWYLDAGSKAFKLGADYAYVPTFLADAEAGRNGLALVRNPLPGDPVPFDWDNDGKPDHVELVAGEISDGRFPTIGGNTTSGAAGDQSNGGGVWARIRFVSDVAAWHGRPVFVHVGR